MELTKREKAIALAMLKYGYSIEKGAFVGDGIMGSDDRMVFEIEYMVNSGELEDLLLEAKKDIDLSSSIADFKIKTRVNYIIVAVQRVLSQLQEDGERTKEFIGIRNLIEKEIKYFDNAFGDLSQRLYQIDMIQRSAEEKQGLDRGENFRDRTAIMKPFLKKIPKGW